MAETACPFCSFSPIPAGADACPACGKPFVEEMKVDSIVTRTRTGAPTGAVTARPGPAALALVAVAVAWLLRVLDVFAAVGDSPVLLLVPIVFVAGAVSLMGGLGPAKHVPVALGLFGIATALLALTSRPVHDGALMIAGALLVLATVSEPSVMRLQVGSALATLAAFISLGALIAAPAKLLPPVDPGLTDPQVGVTWHLPAGWVSVDRLDGLSAPAAGPRRAVLRAKSSEGAQAFLVLDREAAPTHCDDAIAELGGPGVKTSEQAPAPFARGTVVFDLQGTRLACSVTAQLGLSLVVVSPSAPAIVDSTVRVLASGVTLLADPAVSR